MATTKRARKSASSVGGSSYRKAAGLKPIALFVSPDEHAALLRASAAAGFTSMAKFCREAVTAAAEKILNKNGE